MTIFPSIFKTRPRIEINFQNKISPKVASQLTFNHLQIKTSESQNTCTKFSYHFPINYNRITGFIIEKKLPNRQNQKSQHTKSEDACVPTNLMRVFYALDPTILCGDVSVNSVLLLLLLVTKNILFQKIKVHIMLLQKPTPMGLTESLYQNFVKYFNCYPSKLQRYKSYCI